MFDAAYERMLTAEYGPPPQGPSVWFMWDNHCFSKVQGTPEQMGAQILELMEEDHWCGLLTVRQWPDGPRVDGLCFHGDYKNPQNTRDRVARWVDEIRVLF